MENLEHIIFELIAMSGSARSNAFEALESAKNDDFEKAWKHMKQAKMEITEAHKYQTSLIHQEASGKEVKMNILLVHAQDHLMTSILANDLISKMIDMQKEISSLKESNNI